MGLTAIYLYEATEQNWADTGLVGDLQPISCTYAEEKNGISQITMELGYDSLQKYRQVKVGRILKCLVPVRIPPSIENNEYANTADKYKMEESVTYSPIYNTPSATPATETKSKLIGFARTMIDPYLNIFKTAVASITGGGKLVQSQSAKITGYSKNVTYVETVPIPASFAGMEAVETPTRLRYQFFVIDSVEQGDENITVVASHIWNELRTAYTSWKGAENTTYSGAAVCANIMQNAMSTVYHFQVASDSADTVSGKELDYSMKNICEAFLDPEEGVCKKFGLSLIRDNWNFYCLKNVGYDRGFVVQDTKNLLGVTRTEDITDTVTRIIPFAKTSNGTPHYMAGTNYVDSTHIDDYLYPRVYLLDTEMVIGQDGVTDQNVDAKLLAAAQKEFSDNHVDEPKLELDIDFVSLGDTEEYKQYRDLDKVYLYDIITVKDNTRGYNYSAQVVGIEHDVLTGQLLSVKLGSITNSDGVRKIATWQVPSVDGSNIRLQSITVGALADGSVTGTNLQDNIISAGKIIAGEVTTEKLHAGAVTADKIGAGEVTAAKLAADVFTAVDAEISSANIGYAQIKDASVQSLITKDAIADRYYIEKLQVQNLQVLHQTVDNLVIKAANGNYYSLDISDAGVVTPTQVTVTTSEINAGVTNSGRSIIETDLLVTDLAASNIKGANALIDKITAARLDVGELFARQATINQLQTVDISSNTSLQVQAQNQIDLTVGQLNISGSNLILGADKEVSNTDYNVAEWAYFDELTPGETYTFTICLTPAPQASVPYYRLFLSGGSQPVVTRLDGSSGNIVPTGTAKQILKLPFKFSDSGYSGTNHVMRLYRPENTTVSDATTVHWAKLEKGTQTSDAYVPPPNGSDNLLYDSGVEISASDSSTRYFGNWQSDDMITGETYTFTACIKPGSDHTSFTLNVPGTQLGDRVYYDTGTAKQVVSVTFVFAGYAQSDHYVFGYRAPSTVTTAGTVYWAKLCKGVNREAWSPNPNEINNSSIKITNQGIDILTDGTLNMSGAVDGSLNIPEGVVTASKGEFNTLIVNGKTIGSGTVGAAYFFPVNAAFTQGASSPPSGFQGLWLNASGSTILSASRSGPTSYGWINPSTSRTVTLGAPSSTMTNGTFTYTLTFGVTNRQNGNPDSITFTITVTIGGVTFTSSSITLRKWATQTVTITPSATTTNLFSSTGTLTATVTSNYSGTYGPDLDGTTMTLTATKSGTSGQQDVTIKFVT